MSAFHNTALMGASGQGGYFINNSLRFRSGASAYLNRTFSTPTSTQKMTLSCWVKIAAPSSSGIVTFINGSNGAQSNAGNSYIQLRSDGTAMKLIIYNNGGGAGSVGGYRTFTGYLRDYSAWYHIVLAADTTQASAANRYRGYINGVELTVYIGNDPNQNVSLSWLNTAVLHNIGKANDGGGPNYTDAYMAEMNWIDGQQLTPSSFGQYDAVTGQWVPKAYTGTYGTNGFYLKFADTSDNTAATIGKDSSGNGNNWTPNNISNTAGVTYDFMTDSPTVGPLASNYATWNPNCKGSDVSLANGNLDASWTSNNGHSVYATIGFPTTGKWYCEMTGAYQVSFGLVPTSSYFVTSQVGYPNTGIGYRGTDGQKMVNGTASAYGATYGTSDIIAVVYDADALSLRFYKNNADQGAITVASDSYTLAVGFQTTSAGTAKINFGQRPFSYTPPTGYNALNTYNLSAPAIKNGAQYMAATTYTGTGATQVVTNTVNGTAMQPDFLWQKSRSAARDHRLIDTVRGIANTICSDLAQAEYSGSILSSVNSNGFTLNTADQGNNSAETYVAWQWKAGGTAVTNTSGTISSQVSASTTAGFSIVTYTGTGANATVGHGLGVAPSMMIFKNRTSVYNWAVYHASIANASTTTLELNNTDAATGGNATTFNSTAPTSSVFSLGTNDRVNRGSNLHVAYCFAPVAGYSAFGSYTGNGSTDGPFVYLGFRPLWVVIKRVTDGAQGWQLYDNARNPYNTETNLLYPNANNAEQTGNAVDVLSNGFKLRSGDTPTNSSGIVYIYACFAENPFKYSNAR
jgi:hypothetical protein